MLPVGAVLLLIAVGAAGTLAASHIGGITLPGCGSGSPCALAAASAWGAIPGVNWPVSFLGAAFFAGLLAGWIACRAAPAPLYRWIARAGAGVSLLYIGIMFGQKLLCPYCLVAHAANLLFVGLLEFGTPVAAGTLAFRRSVFPAAIVFVVASAALGLSESQTRDRAKASFEQSVRDIVAANKGPTGQPPATGASATTGPSASTGPTAPTSPAAPTGVAAATGQPAPVSGFTGRYRIGPANAPIRIVMITDYQCPDCQRIEGQVSEILKQRPDASLSIKHFPFCTDCNSTPNLPNLHGNACWAARAAEAAGMIGGDAGFKRMHEWLFARRGGFTDAELAAALPGLGFDPASFNVIMQGPETLQRVKADIAEAVSLGLARTPMVFINGVELKNWNVVPDALPKTVAAVAASNPPAGTPEQDRPAKAGEKAVSDWREAIAMAWPIRKQPWTSVPDSVPVRITIFGDLLEPNTAQADKTIRDAIAGRDDIRYEFRYFPMDQTCNPAAPRTMFPGACRAARAAEAAGQLGGIDAYWAMHIWVATHPQEINDTALRAAAVAAGLNGDAFMAKLESPEVARIVADDANLGFRIGLPEIPRIFVNGKVVTRWNVPGQFVLERIIEDAATSKK